MESGPKQLALVVNDEHMQLRLLSSHLSKIGLDVVSFTGAVEALDWIGRSRMAPALIVTDLHMPVIDGWRFCRLLRSTEYESMNNTPILITSATFSGVDIEEVTRNLGANVFLPMPFDPARLRELVQALLEGRESRKVLTALIVEQAGEQALPVSLAFKAAGYDVIRADTGAGACAAHRQAPADVIVLDYHMKDMTGDELLAAFKTSGSRSVVIVVTDDDEPGVALKLLRLGADTYIHKPYDVDYLLEVCHKALRQRSLLRVEDLLEERTKSLRESEERYRSLYTLMSEGLVIYEIIPTGPEPLVQYRIVDANPAFNIIVGLPRERFIQQNAAEALGEEWAKHLDACARVVETGAAQSFYWFLEPLGKHLHVSAFSLGQQRFATVILDITEHRRLLAELQTISETERKRIGQDIHDDIGQHLIAASFKSESLQEQLEKLGLAEAHIAQDIAELISQCAIRARDLARTLCPVDLEKHGLARGLGELAVYVEKYMGVTCRIEGKWPSRMRISSLATLQLYRIAQEALNNAVKHGHPDMIRIILQSQKDIIRMRIEDNGSGLPPGWRTGTGMGLQIMRFRAELANATVDIRPGVPVGTVVECTVSRIGENEP